ncbi:MAG: undecaprenyldiphospho-muramoylpentapeptide beta-N-acetylglucosaminyltransferase [Deltaproteobacteria bacterium]|nr:undecaprenyldiphospho-muramoylpentapeptide beta-N-acetylglucosaminyltransferase [Deltaproteobacteria bacterium]
MTNTNKIIIAGGVTGGHLFPAIAIAEEILKREPKTEILFVSIGNDFEKKILSKKGFKLKSIKTPKLKGTTILKKIEALIKLPAAVFAALIIIKKFSPNLIIGVGSYSSAPVLIAGKLFGIKIAICEQNIIPGITNRYLSKIANRIYIAFKNSEKYFNNKKILHTGNPLRKEIIKAEKTETISDNKNFTVLIIGGSQGAFAINKAVTDSLNHIKNKQKITFIHQSGINDQKKVKNQYSNHKIKNTVCAFIDDIASVYQKADIIIARAGATTISEITALGKAAIYIPFPYAADGHQELNAKTLEKVGACEVISEKNLDGKKLAEKLKYYGANINKLKEMGKKAKKFGKINAAEIIANDIIKNLLG